MGRPHMEPLVDNDVKSAAFNLPGFSRGISYRTMSIDPVNGSCTQVVELEGGFKQPAGFSNGEWELFILDGSLKVGRETLTKDHYLFMPAGYRLPPISHPRRVSSHLVLERPLPGLAEGLGPPRRSGQGRRLRERELQRRGSLAGAGDDRADHRARHLHQASEDGAGHRCVHRPLHHGARLLAGQHLLPRLHGGELPHLGWRAG